MVKPVKLYFVSDAHLGFPDHEKSLVRERMLVSFLKKAAEDATDIYLLGDIFDFWFEYSKVVPKYFTRLLGTIAEITDKGITVHFFTGNHDMWTFGYLEKECGVTLHKGCTITEYEGKRFFISHGDGLGPDDKGYKRLKIIFNSRILQWLFSRFHPNFSFWFAHKWSYNSRIKEKPEGYTFQGEEKERLLKYSGRKLEDNHFDYFIFGHRHVPYISKLNETSSFVLLGDWLRHFTYAVYDGNSIELKKYGNDA